MTTPKRYAVPIEQLESVRVPTTEQVEEQAVVPSPDTGGWAGRLPPAYGDGMGQDADGE